MTDAIYGFVFTASDEQDALQQQHIGQRVNSETAPWTVHYDVATIYVKQWPVDLWFVEVVEGLEHSQLSEDNDYIAANIIRPLKQLPCSLLFGPKGEKVCQLLDNISQITLPQINQLAALANPISTEAYANVWNTWLNKTTNSTMHQDADHSGTLAIGEGENASPIYNGFLTINDLLHKRAKELVGDEAFIRPAGYDDEVYLAAEWSKACSVLLQTAMGLGAEQYINGKDLPLLLLGWKVLNNI